MMLRKLQIPLYLMSQIWENTDWDKQQQKKFFGPVPHEFNHQIKNDFTYANQFGSYLQEIKDAEKLYNKLPLEVKQIVKMEDVGKYIDPKGREYIVGHAPNQLTVRLPPKIATEIDFDIVPEPTEMLILQRRGEIKYAKVISVGTRRKATVSISVLFSV